ncbi:hypothetical protein BLNAU_7470 [Blattamonas nauphoetae]|uniref:Uncharacterized protein n=1 Tax=Blattamonas nauphoetae TaxID=2049346 RepID=A0ABQ9Y1E9_9EUKA|nr:hypothetical protein BLNAU_7470 [Blattamonas nauphoetae]
MDNACKIKENPLSDEGKEDQERESESGVEIGRNEEEGREMVECGERRVWWRSSVPEPVAASSASSFQSCNVHARLDVPSDRAVNNPLS